ncbi:hypothetical protein [Staphylococcus agnetis]|uniref:hypothetical protein n=1 Tax=Staphylococcus agnetis TaxID=985762 RepID=UPI00117EBEB9|nr:hypothetical protein [Staphylococcus agnetis]MBY7664342.1 hypothetical protein [Staphylococcus agnetis]TRW82603.1 hypothetical protein FNK43_05015 [Staphylococcus agnetis]UXU59803.1 hypothetical protein MUA97_01240 [Staphylococcus agnetis]UXU62134.1 hypothetical protein MUA43_01240 [Staphylococcus agnetis]
MNDISPINAYTEKYSAISYQSYKIETSRLKGYSSFEEINDTVKFDKKKKISHPTSNILILSLIRKRG